MTDAPCIRFFSYGTLQDPQIQRSVWGREISGSPDSLRGYSCVQLASCDAAWTRLTGYTHTPALVADKGAYEPVRGTLYLITAKEMEATDIYEGAEYRRIEVVLQSGTTAWTFVKA